MESEKQEKMKKNEQSLIKIWATINICVMKIPEGEEKEKEMVKIFKEIIAEISQM